jgi:hypothetical protein
MTGGLRANSVSGEILALFVDAGVSVFAMASG